jgi:hypothetical protein
VAPDRCARFGRGVVGLKIHLLVFDATPQQLDEDGVPPGALAVHADGDAVFDQHASEWRAGELASLIGVADFRIAVANKSVLKRLEVTPSFIGRGRWIKRSAPPNTGSSPARSSTSSTRPFAANFSSPSSRIAIKKALDGRISELGLFGSCHRCG